MRSDVEVARLLVEKEHVTVGRRARRRAWSDVGNERRVRCFEFAIGLRGRQTEA